MSETPTLIFSLCAAAVMLLLAALAVAALLGSWLYFRGKSGLSPMPTLTRAKKVHEPEKSAGRSVPQVRA